MLTMLMGSGSGLWLGSGMKAHIPSHHSPWRLQALCPGGPMPRCADTVKFSADFQGSCREEHITVCVSLFPPPTPLTLLLLPAPSLTCRPFSLPVPSSSWKQPPASLASICSLLDRPGSPLLTHATCLLDYLLLLECPLCHHHHPPPPPNQETPLSVVPEGNSND